MVYRVRSYEEVADLVEKHGDEEGIFVRVAGTIARLCDAKRMNTVIGNKIVTQAWKVPRSGRLAAVADRLSRAKKNLYALLRATDPHHLRFEQIQSEAEKLIIVGQEMEVGDQVALAAVRALGHRLRVVGNAVKEGPVLKGDVMLWSHLNGELCAAKEELIAVYHGSITLPLV